MPNFPDDPGKPTFVGPFRILPFGYRDSLDSTAVPPIPCDKPVAGARTIDAIRASRVYAEIVYLPPDVSLADPTAAIVCGGEVRELRWSLAGTPKGLVEVNRFIATYPFDVRGAPADSWFTVEPGSVHGLPAVFDQNKPGQHGTQVIYFADGDVVTIVSSGIDFAELLKIAEAIR